MRGHSPIDPEIVARAVIELVRPAGPRNLGKAASAIGRTLGPLVPGSLATGLAKLLEDAAGNGADEPDLPLIANCGLLKAGKSSLFNTLTGAADGRETFATGAARTTIRSQRQECRFGVLIDTPGIDATDADQLEAERTLRGADCVLFVHSMPAGEFDSGETAFLKRLKGFFPGEEFASRVIPVFSKADMVSPEDSPRLEAKGLAVWEKITGSRPQTRFVTSAPRYWNSRRASEGEARFRKWLAMSGVGAILDFLEGLRPKVGESRGRLRRERALSLVDRLLEIVSESLAENEQTYDTLLAESVAIHSRREQRLREMIFSLRALPESY